MKTPFENKVYFFYIGIPFLSGGLMFIVIPQNGSDLFNHTKNIKRTKIIFVSLHMFGPSCFLFAYWKIIRGLYQTEIWNDKYAKRCSKWISVTALTPPKSLSDSAKKHIEDWQTEEERNTIFFLQYTILTRIQLVIYQIISRVRIWKIRINRPK